MSETIAVSGKLRLVQSPMGLSKHEKARWIEDNVADIAFDELDNFDIFHPDMFYLQGEWYMSYDVTHTETNFHVVISENEDGFDFLAKPA
jgi:hypothetical protein